MSQIDPSRQLLDDANRVVNMYAEERTARGKAEAELRKVQGKLTKALSENHSDLLAKAQRDRDEAQEEARRLTKTLEIAHGTIKNTQTNALELQREVDKPEKICEVCGPLGDKVRALDDDLLALREELATTLVDNEKLNHSITQLKTINDMGAKGLKNAQRTLARLRKQQIATETRITEWQELADVHVQRLIDQRNRLDILVAAATKVKDKLPDVLIGKELPLALAKVTTA